MNGKTKVVATRGMKINKRVDLIFIETEVNNSAYIGFNLKTTESPTIIIRKGN
jgi:hypothetical protein